MMMTMMIMMIDDHPVLSCHVLSCPVLSCPVLSCPVLSCPVLSCPVLSCPVLSCPVLSCPVLSCPVLSCPVLSCWAYFSAVGLPPGLGLVSSGARGLWCLAMLAAERLRWQNSQILYLGVHLGFPLSAEVGLSSCLSSGTVCFNAQTFRWLVNCLAS